MELTTEQRQLFTAAKPVNYDDIGSERQVNAECKWYEFLESVLTPEACDTFETFACGATIEECVDYSLELIANV